MAQSRRAFATASTRRRWNSIRRFDPPRRRTSDTIW
jgi:hypothetical protein